MVHVVECSLRAGHTHPGKFVEFQPAEVDVFVNGYGSRNPLKPSWTWLCYGGCLRLSALTLLVLMFAPLAVCGKDPGVGSQEVNLTLQNDRIAVFSDSLLTAITSYLGEILGRETRGFFASGSAFYGLDSCRSGMFNYSRFGVIITSYGSADSLGMGVPWEETESGLRQLLRCLKSTGAVVVYGQWIPDSYYPYGQVCREEGVIIVPNISQGIGLPENLDPRFDSGDGIHPNLFGFSIMAERTARILVDAGLADFALDLGELTGQMPALFSRAREAISAVEGKGAGVDLEREQYAVAEYLCDLGFHYTANWSLWEEVIDPLEAFLSRWEGVPDIGQYLSGLSESANASIKEIEGKITSREAMLIRADYNRAMEAWGKKDYDTARFYFEEVLAKAQRIPEPALLAILSLIMLPALVCRRSRMG